MNHKHIAAEWFRYAGSDIEVAKYLKKMVPCPLEIICYHCHQSTEKYLKGTIAFYGGEIIKTHDLVALNKKCSQYDEKYSEILEDCILLTDYGIQTRYPYEIEIREEDMLIALDTAERIQKFISDIESQ